MEKSGNIISGFYSDSILTDQKGIIMRLFMLTLLCSGGFVYLEAGERPERYLTGNAKIDLFTELSFSGWTLNYPNTERRLLQEEELSVTGTKSPWLAGVLSLAVPGAGEVYTKNYLKAGIFFAAEVTFWALAYSNDKKGDDQTALFQAYANKHWNAVRYTNWTLDHLNALNPGNPNLKSRDEYSDRIYGDIITIDPEECSPPFSCIDWVELNSMERDVAYGAYNGYTHTLPFYNEQQYYELIGKYHQFSRGWDDSDPDPNRDNVIPIRSTSQRFYEYSRMRAKANDFYHSASTWINIALVNHLLSAVDAFWSATEYNKALHASARTRMIPTQLGLEPVPELNIRYEF
jgi:hypothetical protein